VAGSSPSQRRRRGARGCGAWLLARRHWRRSTELGTGGQSSRPLALSRLAGQHIARTVAGSAANRPIHRRRPDATNRRRVVAGALVTERRAPRAAAAVL